HKEAAATPDSPDPYNHIAQTVLYTQMFRSGALESELVTGANAFLRREKMNPSAAEVKEFHDSIDHALVLAEKQLKVDPRDPAALYAKGVSYGLRANYRYLVQKAWLDGLRDATEARKAHKLVAEIDPSDVDATLLQGVYDYLVGSLPFHWKL